MKNFGSEVGIDSSGGIILVQNRSETTQGGLSCGVTQYNYGGGAFVMVGPILPGDGTSGTEFGSGLTLTDNTLIIGDQNSTESNVTMGSLYIYN